jgi:hypothetical protein
LLSTAAISNDSPYETSWSKARSVSDTNSVLRLSADGTWTRTDTRHMIAIAGGTALEDNSQEVHKGRWNAGSGKVYLMGEDNSWEEYTYQVSGAAGGRQLRLVSGKTGQVWGEQ